MKKVLSVFELLTRNTIYKIMLVLVALSVTEFVAFWKKLRELFPAEMQGYVVYGDCSLELVVENSSLYGWFTVAFVLVTVILCLNTCNIGSVQSYTLRRLQISEWQVFWMQSAYNLMCYLLLWGVQLLLLFFMGNIYLSQDMSATNQTLFLAFYRSDFMHSILPMEEVLRWGVNLCLYAGLGIAVAAVPVFSRRRKAAVEATIMTGIIAVGFENVLGSTVPYFMVLVTVVCVGIVISRVKTCCTSGIENEGKRKMFAR